LSRGTTSSYGSWWEHAASWIGPRYGNPSFLLARYEDLLAIQSARRPKSPNSLGIKADEERLKTAVRPQLADTMRKLEQQQRTSGPERKIP